MARQKSNVAIGAIQRVWDEALEAASKEVEQATNLGHKDPVSVGLKEFAHRLYIGLEREGVTVRNPYGVLENGAK